MQRRVSGPDGPSATERIVTQERHDMTTPTRIRSLGGKTICASFLVLGLSACTGSPYDVNAQQCSPSQHQVLVGRNVGEILLPPTLRKREVWASGAMTNDFNPARLTMFVDAKGFVTRVACG